MKKLIILNIHLDMGNRFQFDINLALGNSGAPTSCGFLCPGVVGAGTFCSRRGISEFTFIETKSSGRSNAHALSPLKITLIITGELRAMGTATFDMHTGRFRNMGRS